MDKHSLRDASLPQPLQSDSRGKQFWDGINSQLSSPPAAAAPKRDLETEWSDYPKAVGAGALDLVGGIGELARQASNFGKENAGKQGGDYLEQARANMANKLSPLLDVVAGAGDLAASGAESLNDGMSADAKEALGRRLVDETPEGRLTLGDGAGDIDVWAMKMAQGVGSLLPTLAAGGVTGVAAKASIGRAVTASMVKRGATQEVAEAVAAKAVSKIATGAAVTTGATGSVGSAGVNTRDTVLGMSFDELAASDTFRQSFTRIDQDQQTAHLSDEEKLGLAREETANLASRATMSDAKTWGAAAMGSMMGDAMLFKMLAGKAATGGVLKGAAKGAAGEGISETLEEGVQQYAVNESLNEVAAADIDPMKGVMSSAIEGGLIGMGTGGAVGAVGGARGGKHASQEDGVGTGPVAEPSAPVTEDAAGPAVDPNFASAPLEDGEQAPSASQAEGELNPLGPSASQFPGVFERDQRGILRVKGDVDALASWAEQADMPYITDGDGIAIPAKYAKQAEKAIKGYRPVAAEPVAEDLQPLEVPAFQQLDPIELTPAYQRQGDTVDRATEPQAVTGTLDLGSEIGGMFAGEHNPLGSDKFDPVREVPAFQRQGFVRGAHDFKGTPIVPLEGELLTPGSELMPLSSSMEVGAPRTTPTDSGPGAGEVWGGGAALPDLRQPPPPQQIEQSATIFSGGEPGADTRNSAYTPPRLSRDQVDRSLGEESIRDPRSPVRQSIAKAGSATDSVFGPLQSLRITRKGKPFATEKEAAMASRKGQEMPVPLNGGGFGVAEIAEVERAKAAETTQPSVQQLDDISVTDPNQPSDQPVASVSAETVPAPSATAGEASQLVPAIDTGYREVIPGNQPQAEVSNEPVTPVPAISSEGQRDQPGAGEPAAAGAEPAITGFADGAGAGDRGDLAAPAPVPDGQQQDDQTLTAPATDAGVAVSEVAQPDPVVPAPVAAPTPWAEAIDNPDGTITLKGDVPLIKQWAKDSGVKAIPGKGGLVVSKTSADKVREYAMPAASEPTQQVEAVRADVAQGDTTKPVAKKVRMSQQREGLSVIEASKVVDDFLRDYNGNIPLEPFIREKASEIYGPSVEGTEFARTTKGAYHPSAGLVTIISGNAGDNGSASLSSSASIRDVPVRESENAGAGVSNGAVGEQKSEPGGSRGGESSRERATGRVGKGEGGAREAQTGKVGAKEDLIKTLRHELLGHYGTDTFTPENKRSLLQKLIDAKQQPWLAKEWGAANKGYKHLDEMGRAEEVFASIAEKDLPPRAIQAWNDIKTEFSRMLRKTGLVKGPIKEHELDSLIKAVGKGIRSGERTKQNIRSDQEVIGKQADEPAKDDKPERIIRFSKQAMAQGDKPAKHLTRKEVELVSHGWFKQYRGASGIKVQIHATQAELEGALGLDAKDGLIRRAAFDDDAGTLHVAADTISDPKRMREILRHEVLAHYGLANVLGDGEYTKLMSRLIQSQKDPSMKPVWDWVNTHYADEDIGTQAEEVVAHLAEVEQGAWGRGWDRVVAMVTRALRAVGFVPDGITAAETRSLIEGLGKQLQRTGQDDGGSGGKKFSQEAERPANDGGIKMSQSIADNSPSLEQSITQKAKYQAGAALGSVKNYIKQKRPVMLGTLTDLQIDQVYRDITGGAVSEYQRLRTQMEADRNDILLDAETRIDPLWDALDKQVKTALSNLMHDATMTRLHPDKSLDENSYYLEAKQKVERAKKPETKAAYEAELHIIERNHSELARQYNALPANAKALYDTMQDTYTKQWESLRGAIEQRLEDLLGVNQGRAMAAEMRQKMEHALQHGPYFPLTRYGDYVVKARKGDEYVREHFERRADAEQAVKQYQRDGYNAVMTVKEEGGGDSANANQLGMEMLSFLDSADGVSKSALKDEIWQAMLRMMPDASYAKHAIHRRRVKGASRDAHRAYLNSVYHYARHVSKIRYGHKMQGELDKLSEQIRAGVAGEPSSLKPEDLEIAQQVLNEMNKRHDLNMNPTGKAWAGSAGNIGFLYYIGPSVASAVVNMTQNFTVMLPQLGAKYGFAKSAAAMTQALGDYVKHGKFKAGTTEAWHSLTRSTTLPADERAILDRLYRAGALDLTQAHSIAAKADTDQQDAKPMGKRWRRAMRWAGATFHNAEVLNREVAALAAYRLLKQAEPTLNGQQYADRVAEMVYDGHGNYAASNRPRYMRNDITKVLTQFKIYSQMMTYVLYSNAIKAAKGDKVAQKTLAGVLATHWVMAGVMGLPTPITAVVYAIAAGLDDDDDRSGEASFRLALTEALGPRAGELLAKGPMDALTNLSIAGRTGLGDLWWRSPKEGTEGDDLAWHAVQQLLGPVAGIGINLARGAGQMTDGHIQRGLETMLPKSIRDVAKSYRQATEGEQTIKGDIIMDDVSTWNVAMQGLGFGSAQMAKNYDAREYIKGKEKRIADKRSQLLTDYYMARKSGEMDEVQEVLERIKMFNSINHPRERITGKSLALSFKSKLRSNERTQGGVYLNRNREYLREEGRFAD
ncbi:PLxRFG domain-containing protein [Aeromonas caviae]|uniref:PLxRFG domain-containing protein n=1 Tax=Aeromonas caviae TaxID=648 RepID=UPI0029D8186C|nr:PLxRFG domain-containing protein [Aeromonas caviae]MDX7859076.1 PLxRFG domain-containing protein [Aeromonas caviae]